MKNKLLINLIVLTLLFFPKVNFGQAPNLGTTADFALFTSIGAVSNAGIPYLTKVTGNVGTNSAPTITGFGNVDGQMHYGGDPASTQASADLIIAYGDINVAVPTFFPAPLLGNGQILNAGVYSITAPTITLDNDLTLDAQGDPSAIFILQLNGAFSTNANSEVILANGAQACNVYWKVEGLVDMSTGTSMKGTLIVNNAAINMSTGVILEGRALSTAGAITVDGLLAYTPRGCGLPLLTGPLAPNLASMECYTIFSSDGPVDNVGITNVVGDVGTNNGTVTGFNPLLVVGLIHAIPDASTAAGAVDLLNAYTYLNTLPYDIELLFPALFGHNLVLTPHTYIMNGAVTFTDTVFLNAEGNPNAVFVIQVKGAFATSTFSNVQMINGTKAENIYWMVDGAVSINDFSVFNGTIICNNAAMDLTNGVELYGRALTTTGALSTFAINATMPPGCGGTAAPLIITQPTDQSVCDGGSVSFTVSATGTGLSYQWRRGTTNLVDGGNISGATTATLTINPATILDVATDYNVVVSGTFAPSETSNFVSLTIGSGASITSEPTDQTACAGDSTGFTVMTTGTVLSYQWRKGLINLIDGGNISGATTATLSINPASISDTASDYNVIVTGTCLPNDTSNFVSLSIGGAVITSEPTDQTACAGDSTGFTVMTTGTVLSYQWRKGLINLVDGGNISGATTATLIINPVSVLDTASDYNLIVTGTCLPNDTSNFASLTIGGAVITSEPSDQTACAGDSTGFTVMTTGTVVSYQWRKGTINLIDGGNISGATTATLIINPVSVLDTASDYNLIVTGTCLPNDTSNFASLTIGGAVITSEPTDQTACAGDSTGFTVMTTGTVLSYQWRKGLINLIDGGNISGATTATLIINPVSVLDTASDYNLIVTGTCLPNDTSNFASLTIGGAVITSEPSNQTACAGDSTGFTVMTTGTVVSYQWRRGTINLIDGGNISGATTATLIINPVSVLDTASDYNLIVTGTCLPNDTSNFASLSIGGAVITSEPTDQTVCAGDSTGFTVMTTGTVLSYQWRKGTTNLIDGGNISGATTATLIINPASALDAAADYNLIVIGTCLPNDTSILVSLTVNAIPTAIAASNSPVCIDSSIILSATTVLGATYQWSGPNGYTSSTQNPVILSTTTLDAGIYSLTVTNTGCSSTPATVTVVINDCASDTTIVLDFNIPEGFSPNGDGTNDLFVIRGIDRFPANTFVIFNRWGNKIFEASPYKNEWDGKSTSGIRIGGDDLPVGTYFYLLDLGDGSEIYKGTIYLNK